MKKPNYPKWIEKQKKISDRQQKEGDLHGKAVTLAKISRVYGKNFEKEALRNYKDMKENGANLGPYIERNLKNADRAYKMAAQGYEAGGENYRAERMYRRAGMEDKANEIKECRDRRRESFLADLGISSLIFIFAIGLIFFSFSFTGFSIADNFIDSKFSSLVLVSCLILLTIIFLGRKIVRSNKK